MAWPIVINGNIYTEADFAGYGYQTAMPSVANDIEAVANAAVSAAETGAVTIAYKFSTTTTDADPGAGYLRLNNATQNAATVIRADLLDALGIDWSSVIDTFDDSTSAVKGQLLLSKRTDATKWLAFNITALASPAGYKNITVVNSGSSAASPFVLDDPVLLKFTRTGDSGMQIATATGTADAIAATFTPGLDLASEPVVAVVLGYANATTTPTFSADGGTARTITKFGGSALLIGDLPGALAIAILKYNLANTRWELLNPAKVAITSGVTGLGTNVATFLATPSSANFAAALTDEKGTAGYVPFTEEGTWTPTFTGLTVVGTLSITGKYTKIGRQVFCTVDVSASTSTACTLNSTYFNGLPFAPANAGVLSAVSANVTNLGNGLIGTNCWPQSWSATPTVYLSLIYTV